MAPINSGNLQEDDILKYAEILFKCTLCTSSTSILPDRATFLKHMKDLHLNLKLKLSCCNPCGLKFATKKDLHNHNISFHEMSTNTTEPVCDNNVPVTCTFLSSNEKPLESKTTTCHIEQESGESTFMNKSLMSGAEGANEDENFEYSGDPPVSHAAKQAFIVQSSCESKTLKGSFCTSRPSETKQSANRTKDKLPKNELQKSVGKYASSILIKGEPYFYCQVCMFKTTEKGEFHAHFSGDEHTRTVQKLETPWQDVKGIWSWSGTAAAGCISATKSTPTLHLKAAKSPNLTSAANEACVDLIPGLSDFEEMPSCTGAGQSNKRKQSMPVAVRRLQDMPNIDLTLEEFDENILNIEMYPECLGDSIDLAEQKNSSGYFDISESEIQVKEEPSETERDKQMMKDLQHLIRNIDKASDIPENFQSNVSMAKINESKGNSMEDQNVFECPVCKVQFNTIDLYTNHYKENHVSKYGSISSSANSSKMIVAASDQQGKEVSHAAGRKKRPKKVVPTGGELSQSLPKNLTDVLVGILPSFTEVAVAQLEYVPPERITILQVASEILNDISVVQWKSECNRAIKKLYPNSKLKRKGPNNTKSIYYHGVKMIQEFLVTSPVSNRGACSRLKTGPEGDDTFKKAPKQAKISVSPFGEVTVYQAPVTSSIEWNESSSFQVPCQSLVRDTQPIHENTFSSLAPRSVPSSGIGSLMHLAKFITLYPGPFVTVRNVCQKYKTSTGHVPHVETAIEAMQLLQTFGLGELTSIDSGWTKVFFKAMPDNLTEENSSNVNVKRAVYQAIFSERDCKLDGILHEKLKKAYAQQNPGFREFYPQ